MAEMGFQPNDADADLLFPKDVKMSAGDFMSGIVFDDDAHSDLGDDQTSNNNNNYNTTRKRTKEFFRKYIDDVYNGKEGMRCHVSLATSSGKRVRLCNGTLSVRPSVCLSVPLTKASKQQRRAAGFLQIGCGRQNRVPAADVDRYICRRHRSSLAGSVSALIRRGSTQTCFTEYLRSTVTSVSVRFCLFVCLSASISPELHSRSSPNFLYVLPMAVPWLGRPPAALRYAVFLFVCCNELPLICLSARVSQKPLHGLFCTCYL